jgi:hypothetical protein
MEEWEEEGFASEEAYHQCRLAESEAEQEAEFCMSFVSGGGHASEWREAYRQSQMTEEEFFAELHAQFGEELEAEQHG